MIINRHYHRLLHEKQIHEDQVNEADKLIHTLVTVCSERISFLEDEKKHIDELLGEWDEGHDDINAQLRHFDAIKSGAKKYLDKYDNQKEV
tara:strand:+ start:1215 stop:1487 length:273 start_codon:yes stop_codon:yes gene_type:complete